MVPAIYVRATSGCSLDGKDPPRAEAGFLECRGWSGDSPPASPGAIDHALVGEDLFPTPVEAAGFGCMPTAREPFPFLG